YDQRARRGALDADPCPERRDARADRIERSRWAREQPDRNCGVLHATEQARQGWGNGGPLRGEPSREENEPDEPADHWGLGVRAWGLGEPRRVPFDRDGLQR